MRCSHGRRGVCALRVRRYEKVRENREKDILVAVENAQEAALDAMTYLLVRNGASLYRVTLDADLWPRLIPSDADVGPLQADDSLWAHWETREAERVQKHLFVGLMAIQGLLTHSEILAPLPFAVDVMNPYHAEAFNIVRDDEGLNILEDGSDPLRRVTWKAYREWLATQVKAGSLVFYYGPGHDSKNRGDDIASRVASTYERVGLPWPIPGDAYTVSEVFPPRVRGIQGVLHLVCGGLPLPPIGHCVPPRRGRVA